jgi:hypothetical protein
VGLGTMTKHAPPEILPGGARVVASGTPDRREAGERPAGPDRDPEGSAGADGGGTTRPLTLGAFAGLKLWAHFRVFRSGEGPRMLHYTFFVDSGDISLAETLLRPE